MPNRRGVLPALLVLLAVVLGAGSLRPSTARAADPPPAEAPGPETAAGLFDAAAKAFSTMQPNDLRSSLAGVVDVVTPKYKQPMFPQQAPVVLGDFFNTNPVKSFKFTKREETGSTPTAVGTYESAGENFTVTIELRKSFDKLKIGSMHIEAAK